MKSEISIPYIRVKDAQAVAALIALLSCLLGAGCASRRGASARAGMTVLSDSIEPLRRQFNADKDKLRILALFSPT